MPFTYGAGFFLAAILSAGAGTFAECPGCDESPVVFVERTGAGAGTADFFNTLELTGLLPKDAAGAPIRGAVFSAVSGTRYSEQGVVPEPASVLLLGTGLALGARRWQRRTHGAQ